MKRVLERLGRLIGIGSAAKYDDIISGIKEVNSGNLSKKFWSKDIKVRELTNGINELLFNYRKVLAQIGMNSDQLYHETKKLSAGTVKTSSAMQEIAGTIEDIASGAEKQNEMINDVMVSSSRLVKLAGETSGRVENTRENLEQTVSYFKDSKEIIQQLIKRMQSRVEGNISLSQNTKQISDSLKSINNIIGVVKNISAQTNLLALNASIEAARAGEAGRGFSIVASEIRKLAEESKEAADKIGKMVNSFEGEIVALIDCFDNGISQEQEDSKILSKAGKGFEDMVTTGELTVKTMTETCKDIELQEKEIEKVNDCLGKVTTVAEEIGAGTEQVAAVIEEQSTIIEEMASEAASFEKMSEIMTKIIKEHSQVKIGKEAMDLITNKWRGFAEDLAARTDIIRLDRDEHTKLFKKLSKENNEKIVLYTYKPDSTRVGCNLDGIPPIDLRNRPWFIGALQGKIFISDLYITTDTNEIVLTIAAPIYDKGEVIAVLGLDAVIES